MHMSAEAVHLIREMCVYIYIHIHRHICAYIHTYVHMHIFTKEKC